LIIDETTPERTNRKNIMSKEFTQAAVACGWFNSEDVEEFCVIVFAKGSTVKNKYSNVKKRQGIYFPQNECLTECPVGTNLIDTYYSKYPEIYFDLLKANDSMVD
jgi:hypothetical protein